MRAGFDWTFHNVSFRECVPMTAVGLVSRASPVHTVVRNCTRDEGGPFGFGDQVADPKPPQAAVAKSHGGKRCGNVGTTIPAGTVERGERKRTVAEVKVPITAAWRASRRPGTGQKRRARRRGVQSLAQAYVFNVFGWLAEAARG